MTTKNLQTMVVALVVGAMSVSLGGAVLAVSVPQVQTNAATNVQNTSAVFNGYLSDLGGAGYATVWFEWGNSTAYGNSTAMMTQNYVGSFSQQVFNFPLNQPVHYRAVAQNNAGLSYGQDMLLNNPFANQVVTVNAGPNVYINYGQSAILQGSASSSNGGFITYSWSCTGGNLSQYNVLQPTYTAPSNIQATYICTLTATNNMGQSNSASTTIYVNSSGTSLPGNGSLLVTKMVRNLSSGNLNWFQYTTASLLDVVQFSVTLKNTSNQTVNSIFVKDILPQTLVNYNNLTLDGVALGGDINQGITIGNMVPGQTRIITYQAQVAAGSNFAYGQNSVTNYVSVSSSLVNLATASATVYVNRSGLQGATSVSTGLTNDFLRDSFFLPLVMLMIGLWLWKSKLAHGVMYWVLEKIRK